METRKPSEFFRAHSALDNVSNDDVEAMATGFLQASAFADCSSDDAEGLEDAKWSTGAYILAADTVRVWLDRMSFADYNEAIKRLSPHPDMDDFVHHSIGADIYYEAVGHGVGFSDRVGLEEGGLADRMASCARREVMEGPYLGDDGLRHFLDEYRLFRVHTSPGGSLMENVRRSLNSEGIMLSATGPDSLKATFIKACASGAALADVNSPQYQSIIHLSQPSDISVDEAAVAITASVAMAAMDVPIEAQENVLRVAEHLALKNIISPATIELLRSPPDAIVMLMKPEVQEALRKRDLKMPTSEIPDHSLPAPTASSKGMSFSP